jgi:hypothetical protein
MFEPKHFFARSLIPMHRLGQLIFGLCIVCTVYILFAYGQSARANQPMHLLYQSSPLSPLSEATQANTVVTDTLTSVAPTANRTSQTSLVLVAIVLVGILVVIGLVMWRQR